MGVHKATYQKLVKVAILCHIIENLALVTLTCVSSTENFGKVILSVIYSFCPLKPELQLQQKKLFNIFFFIENKYYISCESGKQMIHTTCQD